MKQFFSSNSEIKGHASKEMITAVLFAGAIGSLILAFMGINRTPMLLLSIVFIFTLFLTNRGLITIARWISLFSALVVISTLLYKNYGIRDTATMGLIVVLISAGLLAGRKGTLIIGTIILGEIILLGYFESTGVIENKFSKYNTSSDYLTAGLTIILITVLQWLIISRLNKNIITAERELNDRIKMEGQLHEAENRYRNLVEKIPAVTYISEPGETGLWHYVSPQITKLTGYTPDEWTTNPNLWFSKIHPDDQQKIINLEHKALRAGAMPQLEYRLLTKKGEYIWVYDESLLASESSTKTITVQGVLLDITARKIAEEQLQKRLAELDAVRGVSETLIAKTDLFNLIEETGDQIRVAFHVSHLYIAIHDPSTNLIRFPYYYGDNKAYKATPIKYGEGMTTRVMQMKKPLLINENWEETAALYNVFYTDNIPAKASLTVPLMVSARAIGVISMQDMQQENFFTENDVQLLTTIAANIAVAIENTQLQDSLTREVAIQEKLIKELETKNAELERFTYTASHDLKSPLITIRGYLGYLEQDARSGNFERFQADIQRISEATDKMHQLLSELLELSRVGHIVNEPQEILFNEIINEALKRVEGQLAAQQITVETMPNLPLVYGDKERLIEVIQNLIDNACKFMGDQKKPIIQIGMQTRNNENIFFVNDNGIGIKKEFHKKIFGLFDKLDPSSNGTGVGLALVKRIIEIHGGRIWIESEGPEKGTTVSFLLPNKNL